MEKEKFNEKKKTTACYLRMTEGSLQLTNKKGDVSFPIPKQTFLGDSWFSNVQTATEMALRGHHYIGIVKTGHAHFPKHFLMHTMQNWPAGSHMVLQTTTREEIDLCAVGYKYNSKKVMLFVFTKGAGHTEPGNPCVARWKDDNGNSCTRRVSRPEVCSKYFANCNAVDVHNQSRQFDLRLEKHWVTQSGCSGSSLLLLE